MKKLQKNWLEWIVFSISFVLVLSTLSYLVYDITTGVNTPPQIQVQLGKPQKQANHYLVPVSATNQGDETAEGVMIAVILQNNGTEQERGEFEIAFLPRQSTRQGWVTFTTDPRSVGSLEARVLGYEKP